MVKLLRGLGGLGGGMRLASLSGCLVFTLERKCNSIARQLNCISNTFKEGPFRMEKENYASGYNDINSCFFLN